MSSEVLTASVTTTDPEYTNNNDVVVKQTNRRGEGDRVAIQCEEDAVNSNGNVVIVLYVNSNGGATASIQEDRSIRLDATGGGLNEYLEVELNQSDPNNWTVNLNTSGGSSYTFKKGSGGGAGH